MMADGNFPSPDKKYGCRTKDIYSINIQPMHPTTMLRMVPRPSKGGHGCGYCILM